MPPSTPESVAPAVGQPGRPCVVNVAMLVARIDVRGMPATQGSKNAFVHNGRAILTESGGDKWRLWRHAVNTEARIAWQGQGPIEGPVGLEITVDLPRPQSAPKRRTWPTKTRSGDVDKLARAILDALTGVVYADDAQVTYLSIAKDWAGEWGPGATIRVTVPPQDLDPPRPSRARKAAKP